MIIKAIYIFQEFFAILGNVVIFLAVVPNLIKNNPSTGSDVENSMIVWLYFILILVFSWKAHSKDNIIKIFIRMIIYSYYIYWSFIILDPNFYSHKLQLHMFKALVSEYGFSFNILLTISHIISEVITSILLFFNFIIVLVFLSRKKIDKNNNITINSIKLFIYSTQYVYGVILVIIFSAISIDRGSIIYIELFLSCAFVLLSWVNYNKNTIKIITLRIVIIFIFIFSMSIKIANKFIGINNENSYNQSMDSIYMLIFIMLIPMVVYVIHSVYMLTIKYKER